ncbi:MAG: type II toxin-antitoxin system HicB family antitoxin [Betaproteobacteria bacterium]|nr:type II toxin-antitoxin system HicB family antitoxin [Betaproteobacteria bacterium]
MNTVRRYKGYDGTVEYDSERQVLRGKILFIHDLVTYESSSAEGIQKEFEAAVDDYVETCVSLGRKPQKPCSGQFSVRIPPVLHKKALERAAQEGLFLNDVVVRALDSYLDAGIVRPYVVGTSLDEGYRAMVADRAREAEAQDCCSALVR